MLTGVIRYVPEERALALSWSSDDAGEFDHALELVKGLPGRRWVAEEKCWLVPKTSLCALKETLALASRLGFRSEGLKFAQNGHHFFPFLSFYDPPPLVFLVPRSLCIK